MNRWIEKGEKGGREKNPEKNVFYAFPGLWKFMKKSFKTGKIFSCEKPTHFAVCDDIIYFKKTACVPLQDNSS